MCLIMLLINLAAVSELQRYGGAAAERCHRDALSVSNLLVRGHCLFRGNILYCITSIRDKKFAVMIQIFFNQLQLKRNQLGLISCLFFAKSRAHSAKQTRTVE